VGDHTVKVPPELFSEWLQEVMEQHGSKAGTVAGVMVDKAAQYGADQELEACIKWFDAHVPGYELVADRLRAARRPKPPPLAEQALASLPEDAGKYDFTAITTPQLSVIRAALTRLAELEALQ
jgi:hypothetical protein